MLCPIAACKNSAVGINPFLRLLHKYANTREEKEARRRRRRHRHRHRLKGIHSRSDTNRTGAEGLSFYYPRLLHCLNQMLAVVLLSQHRVSSSKTVRPRASCGARCIEHAVRTWSAVCSEAPQSQFGEGARPHLCMDEWNHPTPVRRQLSLTQATGGKPVTTARFEPTFLFILFLFIFVCTALFSLWLFFLSRVCNRPKAFCVLSIYSLQKDLKDRDWK